jgi:hypothetical protein
VGAGDLSSDTRVGSASAPVGGTEWVVATEMTRVNSAAGPFSDLPPCLLLRRYWGDKRPSYAPAELHDL